MKIFILFKKEIRLNDLRNLVLVVSAPTHEAARILATQQTGNDVWSSPLTSQCEEYQNYPGNVARVNFEV